MTELIDKLLPLERNLFLALNRAGSPFWDDAMWTYTGIVTWVPMFLFIIYIVFRNQKTKEGLLVLGSIILIILFSQVVSALLFKPLFQRYRPTYHLDFKDIVSIVNDFRGGDYGFISGHATNSIALAIFFSLLFKNRFLTVTTIAWALLNSYSRIYIGVHFISDIVAGLIIGSLLGYLVYKMYLWYRARFLQTSYQENTISIYSKKDSNLMAVFIIAYIILIILFSPILSSISHSLIPDA